MEDRTLELKKEVAELRKEISEMWSLLETESKDTTKHIKKLNQDIIEIYDFIWPIVHRVLPGYASDADAIAALLASKKKDG